MVSKGLRQLLVHPLIYHVLIIIQCPSYIVEGREVGPGTYRFGRVASKLLWFRVE